MTRPTAGFTLIELLVALTLTGLVVLIGHEMLTQLSDAGARGRALAQELDREGNRYAWLLRAFGSVVVGSAPMRGFEGRSGAEGDREADRVAFVTWLAMPTGSLERSVRLWLEGDELRAEVRSPLVSQWEVPDTLVLADGLRAFGADYLTEYGASSPWLRDWVSPVSAPLAVRLRVARADGRADTLLLHVGTRG